MLKHGILGLLNYSDMTGYMIMEVFRDSLNYFWNAQTSQIYRELQNLKKQGWVSDIGIELAGKPDKKLFSITESGREELHRWLAEEDTGIDTRSPLLMRTFFRGEMPVDENIAFFERVKAQSDEFLTHIQEPNGKAGFYENAINEPMKALYWKMTIEYGVMYMKMIKEWSEKCISELEAMNNESSAD